MDKVVPLVVKGLKLTERTLAAWSNTRFTKNKRGSSSLKIWSTVELQEVRASHSRDKLKELAKQNSQHELPAACSSSVDSVDT